MAKGAPLTPEEEVEALRALQSLTRDEYEDAVTAQPCICKAGYSAAWRAHETFCPYREQEARMEAGQGGSNG